MQVPSRVRIFLMASKRCTLALSDYTVSRTEATVGAAGSSSSHAAAAAPPTGEPMSGGMPAELLPEVGGELQCQLVLQLAGVPVAGSPLPVLLTRRPLEVTAAGPPQWGPPQTLQTTGDNANNMNNTLFFDVAATGADVRLIKLEGPTITRDGIEVWFCRGGHGGRERESGAWERAGVGRRRFDTPIPVAAGGTTGIMLYNPSSSSGGVNQASAKGDHGSHGAVVVSDGALQLRVGRATDHSSRFGAHESQWEPSSDGSRNKRCFQGIITYEVSGGGGSPLGAHESLRSLASFRAAVSGSFGANQNEYQDYFNQYVSGLYGGPVRSSRSSLPPTRVASQTHARVQRAAWRELPSAHRLVRSSGTITTATRAHTSRTRRAGSWRGAATRASRSTGVATRASEHRTSRRLAARRGALPL